MGGPVTETLLMMKVALTLLIAIAEIADKAPWNRDWSRGIPWC